MLSKIKNKYFLSLILLILAVSVGAVYLTEKEKEKISCVSCTSKQKQTISKIETVGPNTFEDTVKFGAVATFMTPQTKYFNWKPENPCPDISECYLKNITARVTIINTGDSSFLSQEGAAYIQIANSKESNCDDPSQATFTRYLAYSPPMRGGEAWHKRTCGEPASPNTCNLSKEDGFNEKSECFSLKLAAPNTPDGSVNFATHLISLTYTWEIAEERGNY
jgi:hypothetical protein